MSFSDLQCSTAGYCSPVFWICTVWVALFSHAYVILSSDFTVYKTLQDEVHYIIEIIRTQGYFLKDIFKGAIISSSMRLIAARGRGIWSILSRSLRVVMNMKAQRAVDTRCFLTVIYGWIWKLSLIEISMFSRTNGAHSRRQACPALSCHFYSFSLSFSFKGFTRCAKMVAAYKEVGRSFSFFSVIFV